MHWRDYVYQMQNIFKLSALLLHEIKAITPNIERTDTNSLLEYLKQIIIGIQRRYLWYFQLLTQVINCRSQANENKNIIYIYTL